MTNEKIIAVDAGYGETKWMLQNGKRAQFQSIYAIAGNTALPFSSEPLTVRIDGKNEVKFLYGEDAVGNGVQSSVENDRLVNITGILLIAAALWESEIKGDVVLSTGTPLSRFLAEEKAAKAFWTGKTITLSKSGKKRDINITKCNVSPQGVAALFAAINSREFKSKLPERGLLTGIIEIGSQTSDVSVATLSPKLVVKPNLSMSSPHAMDELSKGISTLVAQEFGFRNSSKIHQAFIDSFIKTGVVNYKGKKVDFREAREAFLTQLGNTITADVKTKWGDDTTLIDSVFIAGGGAPILKNYLHFDNMTLLQTPNLDPQYGNAKGYILWSLQEQMQRQAGR